jgi:2-oxoglutarate ferredoxin oxidoreductase subunit delta
VAVEVKVVEKYCKGCGLCVAVCPNGTIFIRDVVNDKGVNAAAVKNEYLCKACMKCVLVCPEACIEITKTEAGGSKRVSAKARER